MRDRYGLPLSTASAAAAAAYGEGVDRMLAAWPGAQEQIEEAITSDEGFALAHAASARLHQIYGRGAQARAAISKARERVAGATPRERAHVEILGLAVEGQGAKALAVLLPHLDEYPRDALAFSLALGAFGLYAFGGRADHDAARLALCERLAPKYDGDWWFPTHLGWSHTEAGNLAEGERHTAHALELRKENAHASHAMAHWYVEAARKEEGTAFIQRWLPLYRADGLLYSHLSWHQTLGDPGLVRSHYEERLRPSKTAAPPINRISDSAALLWRLSLSQPVPAERWQELAAYASETFAGPAPHFIEWHLAMPLAALRDQARLDVRLADIHAREASGAIPTGGALEAVVRGLAAFGREDFQSAVQHLGPAAPDFARLGGSGAQRRILHDTLATAMMRVQSNGRKT
jgi:hypothetical protein